MSSSKRGKRRKKSNSLARYAGKKDQSSNDDALGVNFTFLMLGMITSLMAFLLVFSLFSTPPKTSRALEAAKSGDASEEVNATDDDEFDKVLENSDATQLTNILKGLNAGASERGLKNGAKTNQRRVDVANHLLGKKLDKAQRKLAITSKLNALTTVYGISLVIPDSVPNVAESLRDTSKTYLDSPDSDVQKLAKLSLVKVNSFEMTKSGNEVKADLLVGEMCQLLKDYPNDELVVATIDTIIQFYRTRFDPAAGREITRGLQARESEFVDSPAVGRMLRDFEDETILSDSKYVQLFDDRWVDGARGQQELLKKSLQLAAEPSAGNLLIKTVDRVAHWFEQDDQYEKAVAIYEEMLGSVDSYKNPEIAAIAKKKAQDGIARSKIVGKEIDLSGVLLNGKEYSIQEVKGRVALVVFWSMFEPKSTQALGKLSVSGRDWKTRGIRIIAVNIDRTWQMDLITDVTKPIENVTFLFGDASDNYSNNILRQCPSDTVPRIMLVQRDGRVADINVPIDEVETQLDFLDQ